MHDAQLQVVIDALEGLIEKIRDAQFKPDAENGKVVWPIPDEVELNLDDMMATLFDISEASLTLSFYDATGSELTDTLSMTFMGQSLFPGAPTYYARRSLKEMLEEELRIYVDEENEGSQAGRLLARLVKAFDEA